MNQEQLARPFDTVSWKRHGAIQTGMVREIRGQVAMILTGHGEAMVYVNDLEVFFPREQWNPEALKNHLWAVYGVRCE